jgi:hypothetical protein
VASVGDMLFDERVESWRYDRGRGDETVRSSEERWFRCSCDVDVVCDS